MSDDKIVPFRPPEISAEDRARRLQVEVERLARLPTVEWMFYASREDHVQPFGVTTNEMKQLVEAIIKENQKKQREAKAEEQRREQRAEKQRTGEQRKQERQQREQREQHRADEKAKKAAKQEAERKQRERTKEFAKLLLVPAAEHEQRLAALAKRLGEEVEFLRSEFAQFLEVEEASRVSGTVEPWPEPVLTGDLMAEVMAQLRRYVVIHGDAEAMTVVLWIFFAWVHAEVATHSPILLVNSADGDTGKTTLCAVISYLTPRSYCGAELTGPTLYRFIDHVHPTLIIDDADKLLPRKPDLAHIINVSWTKGTKIPRQDHGVTRWFDPFCPKLIAGVNVQLQATTATRTLPIWVWPKLESEKVEDFSFVDDDTLYTLRRKLARWAIDNVAALKRAHPSVPVELINRQAANWKLPLAIAELAGRDCSKVARAAAVKLSRERQRDPSDSRRLLAAFRDLFAAHGPMLISADVQRMLVADQTSVWADYRGHPITQREVALLLAPFGIRSQVIHPRGRKADRGYKVEWFEKAFRHYLQTPSTKRSSVRKKPGKSSGE
jgi:hypothetical protein